MTRRQVVAGLALGWGLVVAVTLSVQVLRAPLPGQPPEGSGLEDASSVELLAFEDAPAVSGPTILMVFHDQTVDGLQQSDRDGIFVANLLGHFGPVTIRTAAEVTTADLAAADATVYVRSLHENDTPPPVLRALADPSTPFMWVGPGLDKAIDDPVTKVSVRSGSGGDLWSALRFGDWIGDVDTVEYNGVELPREPASHSFREVSVPGPGAQVLATAESNSQDRGAWAVRSDVHFYVVEAPSGFQYEDSNWLAFADILIEFLDPEREPSRRAMVRLEDVGPMANPDVLRDIADGLWERNIPFSIAVYPIWVDEKAKYRLGTDIGLKDRPAVVKALKYMQERGGTILFHGVTHQYGSRDNPYSGTSGEDYEFYLADIDGDDNVVNPGPVPHDSVGWVTDRIKLGFAEFEAAGLERPTIFEFPHYLGSVASYRTIAPMFDARYERGSYFPGLLTGEPNELAPFDQILPYPATDLYGELVLPENLGNLIPVGYNNNDARTIADIVAAADLNRRVVRDSYASFFYHPYLGSEQLFELVDGIADQGFEFVSPAEVLADWAPGER